MQESPIQKRDFAPMLPELTEFPQEGIDYSHQALEALEASPWLEELVQSTVTTLMTDLLDVVSGIPIPDQSPQSLEHLRRFAQGGPQIGVHNEVLSLEITRRSLRGWEITRLAGKTNRLH